MEYTYVVNLLYSSPPPPSTCAAACGLSSQEVNDIIQQSSAPQAWLRLEHLRKAWPIHEEVLPYCTEGDPRVTCGVLFAALGEACRIALGCLILRNALSHPSVESAYEGLSKDLASNLDNLGKPDWRRRLRQSRSGPSRPVARLVAGAIERAAKSLSAAYSPWVSLTEAIVASIQIATAGSLTEDEHRLREVDQLNRSQSIAICLMQRSTGSSS